MKTLVDNEMATNPIHLNCKKINFSDRVISQPSLQGLLPITMLLVVSSIQASPVATEGTLQQASMLTECMAFLFFFLGLNHYSSLQA